MEVAYRWQHIEDQFKARMAVTPEDMMRVAKKYFTRDNCVTGVLERDGGGRAMTAPNENALRPGRGDLVEPRTREVEGARRI